MDEDWSLGDPKAKFCLIRDATPEEEAKKDGYVDTPTYNRWKKAQRRLYQKLKLEHIARSVCKDRTVEDLSNALNSLSLIKKNTPQPDSSIDKLIDEVQKLQLESSKCKPFTRQ